MKIKGFMIKKGIQCLKDYGVRELLVRVIERKKRQDIPYDAWYQSQKIDETEWKRQRAESAEWNVRPVVSICVPLYKTPEKFLCEMIDSVCNQTYGNWQLCLADGSPDMALEGVIKAHYPEETRIRYKHLDANLGIADNTNAAFALAEGEWIGLLDHDDILAPEALYESMKAAGVGCADVKTVVTESVLKDEIEAVYSDEDKITEDLTCHFDPHFKPDYNLDLLCSNNYITHFFIVKRAIVEQVGGFCKDFDGSQDYDFILRCTTKAKKTAHVPRILYHWRTSENSTAENPASKMYAFEAGKRAIETHLQKEGIRAEVLYTKGLGFYQVKYQLQGSPAVSVISYGEENVSEIAERIAKENGEYLLLLGKGVCKPSDADIQEMLSHCQQCAVATIGPKLIDKKKKVYSAGQIFGRESIGKDVYVGLPSHYYGYMHRASTQIAYSMLNRACVLIKKEAYQSVGGLDTAYTNLDCAMADLFLRLGEAGYRNVYTPYVEVVVEDSALETYRFGKKITGNLAENADIKRLKVSHKQLQRPDANYNKNLSVEKADYTLNIS